ncbi:MAG TPA: universal stress protein [Nitrososphaeraceae archaeon]|jgi:nucleotide-binding universal stress UspA family protein
MFKKILVPYDGSKHAEIALNKAINLSRLIKDSEVVVLTVLEELNTPTLVFDRKVRNYKTGEATTLSTYMRDLQKAMRNKMTRRLDELRQRYDGSVQVRTLVSVGRPEVKIIECTNNLHVDIIVMGSRGIKGISRLLMGSVSRKVSERANCTVMIVR